METFIVFRSKVFDVNFRRFQNFKTFIRLQTEIQFILDQTLNFQFEPIQTDSLSFVTRAPKLGKNFKAHRTPNDIDISADEIVSRIFTRSASGDFCYFGERVMKKQKRFLFLLTMRSFFFMSVKRLGVDQ